MSERRSTCCPMDCPDTCALEVEVEGGRVGKLHGRRDHPITDGFICSKVARFAERVHGPERVLNPLRRVGPKGAGEFVRMTWDEAVTTITTRFRQIAEQHGGEAIVPFHYGGSNGLLSDELLDHLYFARWGASQLDKTFCAAPTGAAALGMYGKMPGVSFSDFERSQCILLWGTNPRATNIHLMPILHRAKANGAFVAVIDPQRNLAARESDLHLPVLPGTDLPLALAMIAEGEMHGWLDEAFLDGHAHGVERLLERAREWPLERAAEVCGVGGEVIARLTRVYAESSPAVVRCGWGLERNRNGGDAAAAILALPAMFGKFGLRGGGYTMSNSGATKFDRDRIFGPLERTTRTLNMSQIGPLLNDENLDPPIRALFIYNANPAVTAPEQNAVLQGLAREDLFTVVSEQVMTDTALYADIVLPATTFLEHYDVRRSYGAYVLGGVAPVIDAVGEARSNQAMFAALGRAAHFEDEAFHWSEDELLERVADALSLEGTKPSPEALRSGEAVTFPWEGEGPVQFVDVYPRTSDGRIDLAPSCLGTEPYRYRELDSRYPLALISPASARMVTSTMGEYNFGKLDVRMHPDDARSREIDDGMPVRVWNDLGDVDCVVKIDEKIRPGVVAMAKGAWLRSSANGRTSTALCPSDVNDVAGGACYNDARVEVRRLI